MLSLSQSLVVISTLFAATLALPDNCSRTYSVQPGDTCDAIAAAQGVSTYQIMTVNSVTVNPACTNLIPGETICLAVKGQDCQPVAVVQMGDSCSSIATGAGISVSTLLANNPNVGSGCQLLYPGEVVCVDSQVVVKSN